MIEISNVRKEYGGNEVLNVEELKIGTNEILGLVGNNGAGKTTLFSIILDLIRASEGSVKSKDQDVSKSEDWKFYTGSYLNDGFLIEFLTPEEYFEFVGSLHGLSPTDVYSQLESFNDIFAGEILGTKKYIRDLSIGNRKKVGLAATLIGNPEVVIWDEPFSNLDPSTQLRVRNAILENKENKTFLVSSHDLTHIAEVSTRVVILDKGKIVKDVQNSEATKAELFQFFEVT